MRVIGLTGPAHCGKDTVATFLCDTQGFVQVAFADPMRAGLKAIFPMLTDEHFTDPVLKETVIPEIGRSPRELLQTIGTEWGRKLINPDLWVYLASRIIDQLRRSSPSYHINGIVISDIRLENEASYVRDMGELWHIYRPGSYSNLTDGAKAHSSENGIQTSPHDRIIVNGGSIEDLYESINRVISNEEQS
ncbi:dephospho-CoA kinase [Nitrosospira sp. Nsp2]|uniref:deoxynucleotide monophosphate kinase family protein n=1 Tax=Nitrosospira sp. Nsp2 TaxID=136548 RepID=UPI000D30B685|nr:deoxynucleotide monophosphate kinase [Nitrosospira sp. Nsp2]PTR17468.1 dephospho-CoA kinase [Nitrosospira sp. Nsp2]